MVKAIYDITRVVDATTPVWPGDQGFEFEWTMNQDRGDSVNVGRVVSTLHLGTHVDAPLHFRGSGPAMSELAIDIFLGPAQVIDVSGKLLIGVDDLAACLEPTAERVLLRTNSWRDAKAFPNEIAVIAPEVAAYLASRRIRLLGVDVPSVDRIDSRDLPNHRALEQHGVAILESVDLSSVPVGTYELIALPLRLAGADASPVRAILRSR